MKKLYEDEIELKKDLDSIGVRYGDTISSSYQFLIYFTDNKGNTVISRGLYPSPIAAIRSMNGLIEKVKIPADDLDIKMLGVLDEKTNEYFSFNCTLSPFLYYKKTEKVDVSSEPDQE